jgi:hypothetical protein
MIRWCLKHSHGSARNVIGAMLKSKPPAYWDRVLDLLGKADLEKIKAQFPDYPHSNLFRAIQVSVDALESTARGRYFALAVLLEDMPAHHTIQQTLWNVDEGEALETAEQFVSLSLAQRDDSGDILFTTCSLTMCVRTTPIAKRWR